MVASRTGERQRPASQPKRPTRAQQKAAALEHEADELRAAMRRARKRERKAELAEQLAALYRGPGVSAARPGREGRPKRAKTPPAASPYRRPATLDVPDITPNKTVRRHSTALTFDGERLTRISSVRQMKSQGWYDRYQRTTAREWFGKAGQAIPAAELRSRTIYEQIRDAILRVPPELRGQLVMRVRSKVLGKTTDPGTGKQYGRKGLMIAVPTDNREALVSIPGLLYTAGVRQTPDSPGEGVVDALDVTFFVTGAKRPRKRRAKKGAKQAAKKGTKQAAKKGAKQATKKAPAKRAAKKGAKQAAKKAPRRPGKGKRT